MFSLIQALVAWATSMFAAALFVTAATQLIRRTARLDAIAVEQLVHSIFVGFRSFYEPASESAESEPVRSWRRDGEAFTRAIVDSVQMRQPSQPNSAFGQADRPEYIRADDLVGIVYQLAKAAAPPTPDEHLHDEVITAYTVKWVEQQAAIPFPSAWLATGADGVTYPYANTKNFALYLDRWFDNFASTMVQKFKVRLKRMSVVLAATIVILLNIDTVQLLKDFYQSSDGQAAWIKQAPNLELSAERLGVAPPSHAQAPDGDSKALLNELQKTSIVLTTGTVHVGWKDSPIARSMCVYERKCDAFVRPSFWGIASTVLFWFLGLLASWAFISLGAPFWYSLLRTSLRWDNELKPDNAAPSADTAGSAGSR